MTINTKIKLTKYLRDAFIKAVMADVPKIDYDEQIRQVVVEHYAAKLPPAIRAVWDNPATRPYVKLGHGSFYWVTVYAPSQENELPHDLELAARINDISALQSKQTEVRSALAAGLHSVVYGCKTYKALHAALPEFEKYFPKEQPKVEYPVAVTNVVTDFMRAGWPKGD